MLATDTDLAWVRDNIVGASALMKDPHFNRAFQAFDGSRHISSRAAGIVISWAFIETLLRPGNKQITDRICRALAAYLYPSGSERDRGFTRIRESYGARGGIAHASAGLCADEFDVVTEMARRALMKTVEVGHIPNIGLLLRGWAEKS